MKHEIDFSPILYIKESDGTMNSAISVDNGPRLMNERKKYTNTFNTLLDMFPDILTAAFYGKTYTNYRIKVEGVKDKTILSIKKFLAAVVEPGEDEDY